MHYRSYHKRVERELDNLNLLIDEKILHGLSYKREAKRHKALFRWARHRRQPSLLTRLSSVMALF